MSNKSLHFADMLDLLQEECLKGLSHYRIWRDTLNKVKENEDLQKFSFFFQCTLAAHIDTATLYANRLFDKNSNAVTLKQLLNYADKNPEVCQHATDEEITEALRQDRDRLRLLEGKVVNLREQRNSRFVHLSKEHLGNYDALFEENPLKYEHIHELLEAVGEILNRYLSMSQDATMIMKTHQERDTGILLDILGEGIEARDQRYVDEAIADIEEMRERRR